MLAQKKKDVNVFAGFLSSIPAVVEVKKCWTSRGVQSILVSGKCRIKFFVISCKYFVFILKYNQDSDERNFFKL